MATKKINYIEIQNNEGAVFYPHSSSDVIFMKSGRTVEEDMPEAVRNPVRDTNGHIGDIINSHLTVGKRDDTQPIGPKSFTAGDMNAAIGDNAFIGGYACIADILNSVFGKFNKPLSPTDVNLSTGDVFAIGCGLDADSRRNALRASASGKVYTNTTIQNAGADFAEFFEWIDGNENGEDRRGLFVTLDGEKIKFASCKDDYILGVVSAVPTIAGNACPEEWNGQYLTDVFGEPLIKDGAFILNPRYDPSQEYIPRENRNEWGLVGMLGQLIVRDDGSCQINGYCYPDIDGVATASEHGYRVMARVDERHIRILFR